jgi:hypothetical protein
MNSQLDNAKLFPFPIKVNGHIVGYTHTQDKADHLGWCLTFQALMIQHKNDDFVELFLDYLEALKKSSYKDQ